MTERPEDYSEPRDAAHGGVAVEDVALAEPDTKTTVQDQKKPRYELFAPDAVSTPSAIARIGVAAIAGGVVALLAFFVLKQVSLAAFNVSMVTRALATAGSLLILIVVAVLLWLWIRDRESGRTRPAWRRVLTEAVCGLAPAGLVVTAIAIPLSATKLYLDGIQVDQGFRTQYLTRMTETMSHQDMNYADLPSFYPIGWFWLGGRLANLLNMSGWEVYQPWALVSLAAAGSALVPLWRRLTGSLPAATAIALITTAVVLTMVPEEPYAAVVAMGVPVAAVLGYRAMGGSWTSTIAVALYLGASACFYTLYTGIMALTMIGLAFISFIATVRDKRSIKPFVHLVVMGLGSICIALLSWGPYLVGVLTASEEVSSAAQHFLPSQGTTVPLPFFHLTMVGVLSLVGVLYLLVRYREPVFTALGVAVTVCYVWVVASMVVTLAGTTLLGFRVEVLIALLLSTAGVLALMDLRLNGVDKLYPTGLSERTNRTISTVFIVGLALSTLSYVQQIPEKNEVFLDQAYSDTNGDGERADRRESSVGRYYNQMDEFIQKQGYEPTETVVLTDEINFLAYHPYYGFNAFTNHYANPLGQFEARGELIAQWAHDSYEHLKDPKAMTAAIDASPWRAPDVFIFRGSEKDQDAPWKTHVAHDIFPSEPNIRYQGLFFNPDAFDSADWTTKQFGPFVVVVRNR